MESGLPSRAQANWLGVGTCDRVSDEGRNSSMSPKPAGQATSARTAAPLRFTCDSMVTTKLESKRTVFTTSRPLAA